MKSSVCKLLVGLDTCPSIYLEPVCKIKMACHSEERSDEESLLLPKLDPFRAEPRPFATAQGDINLICIQAIARVF